MTPRATARYIGLLVDPEASRASKREDAFFTKVQAVVDEHEVCVGGCKPRLLKRCCPPPLQTYLYTPLIAAPSNAM